MNKKSKLKVTRDEYDLIPKKRFFRQIEFLILCVAIIFIWSAKDDPNNYEWYCVHTLISLGVLVIFNAIGVVYTRIQYRKHRIRRKDVLDPLL